jgi:hypothetical protein
MANLMPEKRTIFILPVLVHFYAVADTNMIYTGHGYYNKTKTGVPRKETRRKFNVRKDNYAREGRPPEEWVPITAPAIISAPIFAKAQEQLQRHQEKARRAYQPTSQRYLLRTLVRCGHCQLHIPTVCPSHNSASLLSYQALPTNSELWRGHSRRRKEDQWAGLASRGM